MKHKKTARYIFTAFFCLVFFASFSFLYLTADRKKSDADHTESNIPYENVTDCGVLFTLPSGKYCLFYLSFQNEKSVLLFPRDNVKRVKYGNYTADYEITLDYGILEGIVDRVGGIELDGNRLTGVQAVSFIAENESKLDIQKTVGEKIIEQISKNGFSKSDFVYIIENSDTNLAVPDCFYWESYMSAVCKSCEVIS